jgi:hypothetical protein
MSLLSKSVQSLLGGWLATSVNQSSFCRGYYVIQIRARELDRLCVTLRGNYHEQRRHTTGLPFNCDTKRGVRTFDPTQIQHIQRIDSRNLNHLFKPVAIGYITLHHNQSITPSSKIKNQESFSILF